MTEIQKELFALQDLKYRDFTSKLIPTVDKEKMIGIRTPVFRKFAKNYVKNHDVSEFLKTLPHEYYEENNIHAAIVAAIPDFETAMRETERFLPFIDNWATCDGFSPAIFKKYPDEVYEKIKEWLKSDKTYTIRFGIGILMGNYLDDNFRPEMLKLVASVKSEEYYVNMMIAWFFATALAKKYDATLPIIKDKKLAPWTHNKSIQKAIESYRITDEQKAYLKTLKVKTR